MEINGKYSPNREVRYRGKSISTNEWIYGNCIGFNNEEGDAKIFTLFKGLICFSANINPESVGQSLGIRYIDEFTQEEGQEVFEGDICHIEKSKFDGNRDEIWTIEYDTLECGYIAYNQLNSSRRIEYEDGRHGFYVGDHIFITIKYHGNRFDNPEFFK